MLSSELNGDFKVCFPIRPYALVLGGHEGTLFNLIYIYIFLVHIREWFSNPVTTKQMSVKAPKLIV